MVDIQYNTIPILSINMITDNVKLNGNHIVYQYKYLMAALKDRIYVLATVYNLRNMVKNVHQESIYYREVSRIAP